MQKITRDIQEFIEEESGRIARSLPIKIFIGGKEIDIDDQAFVGEEIHISIELPVFFSETGKLGYLT